MNSFIKRLFIVSLATLPLSPVFSQGTSDTKQKKYSDKKSAAQDAAKLANIDKVVGHGGVLFGTPLPDSGFTLLQDRGDLKTYKKADEKLLIGPALLESVVYYFFKGKFYGFAFHTNSHHTNDIEDALALKNIFIDAFGSGENSAGGEASTIWLGKKTGLIYDLNTSTGDASSFLFDKAIHETFLTDFAASEQTAAEQLIK